MSAQWGPDIERWWGEGLDRGEIARRLGTTPTAVSREVSTMRARGVKLAYRQAKNPQTKYKPATYETADAVDPDGLIAWLRRHDELDGSKQNDARARTIRWWKQGRVPSFYVVDRLLVELGYHISDLPDDVWLKRISVDMARAA